ncbi:hypothetical protein [Hymenobacter cheonanensis]|uniref:hypothetical protein n=1 Tax=Hymenobacter sp. CA2-7 TaxID=3063993 RepID=UPI0027141151|nr:hypothetical protein [Hymenobacter sp. CA2-7]MDO7886725.1 hypothetical protein [Hymenobacter sp. CA2-7]
MEPPAELPLPEEVTVSLGCQQLEFVAEKSKNYLQQQDEIIRHRRQNAGMFVTLLTALLTFFFSQALPFSWWRLLVLLPLLGSAAYTFWLFFSVMLEREAASGLDPAEFNEVIRKSYEDVLLLEIAANQAAITINGQELTNSHTAYNRAVLWSGITVAWTLVSCLLLKFVFPPPDSPPQQLAVTCQQYLKEKPLRSAKIISSPSLSVAASSVLGKDSLVQMTPNPAIKTKQVTSPNRKATNKSVSPP